MYIINVMGFPLSLTLYHMTAGFSMIVVDMYFCPHNGRLIQGDPL